MLMRLFSVFFSLILCLTISSCGARESAGTDEILADIMEYCDGLPQGVIYTSDADEGEEGYLSPALAEALWGEDACEGFSMLEEYSVYLSSFATPYEIGVYRCYSSTDARRIEELCRARADIVSVALRKTEYYTLCQNIRICRRGREVVFLMTDSPEDTLRLAKRLIS